MLVANSVSAFGISQRGTAEGLNLYLLYAPYLKSTSRFITQQNI